MARGRRSRLVARTWGGKRNAAHTDAIGKRQTKRSGPKGR